MSPASRLSTVSSALQMKKGTYLAEAKHTEAFLATEFKLKPTGKKSVHDFLVDGDPMDNGEVHVRVMHKALKLFAVPAWETQPAGDDDSNAPSGSLSVNEPTTPGASAASASLSRPLASSWL